MQSISKTFVMSAVVSIIFLASGCTDWKKKYENLNVEHQNTVGLLEREKAEKGQMAEQVAASEQTIQELQKKIAEQKQTPAAATGFGEGYDVSFNAAAGTVTVTLSNEILFAPGKATLKKSQSKELDHIYSVIKEKYSGKPIDVVGYTDSDPIQKSKWTDNWELSAERSLAVVRYFIQKGISGDKIRAVGCGDSRPVASNSSASGKAKNRRVEIVVHVVPK